MRSKISAVAIILFLIYPVLTFAGAGLSTHWGEVAIYNIGIGQTYSVEKSSNMTFDLVNTGDAETDIQVDVILPSGEPKEGYEPLPSTSWITLDQNKFHLKPGETAKTDVKISIPDNKKYLGKKYQVHLFAYTVEKQGFMGVGLKSRLLLSLEKSKGAKTTVNQNLPAPDMVLQPSELLLDVKIGEKYDLEKLTGRNFELKNFNDKVNIYKIKSIKVEDSPFKSPAGYENCPDTNFLKFKSSRITVVPKGTGKVKVYLDIPNKAEYKDKKYMFVIYTTLADEPGAKGIYNRIYVSTK
jgi:hypothetical protein